MKLKAKAVENQFMKTNLYYKSTKNHEERKMCSVHIYSLLHHCLPHSSTLDPITFANGTATSQHCYIKLHLSN